MDVDEGNFAAALAVALKADRLFYLTVFAMAGSGITSKPAFFASACPTM